jgi:hypothetical protein
MLPRKVELAESKLWPKNQIVHDESILPLIPRFCWLWARKHFEANEHVSSILMAGLAVESGLNEYACIWMNRKFGIESPTAMKFLEESMDFRKTIELLSFVGAIEEGLDSALHSVYDSRNRYAHIQTSKILGKLGDEAAEIRDADGNVTAKITFKDEEVLRTVGILTNAGKDARIILEKAEYCLAHLFESDYWKRLLRGEVK